ncbi:MAG: hypothetical protein QXN55_01205 [Candidatus Nitrosotenuis sp.]
MSYPFSEERLTEINSEIEFLDEIIKEMTARQNRYMAISGITFPTDYFQLLNQLHRDRSLLKIKAVVLEDYLQG